MRVKEKWMKLVVLIGDTQIMDYLFGGGVPVMAVYLVFVALDIITGYIKALKSHRMLHII
ncbi:phage holin family protein [Enterococcus gallinarum]|uniref:phage holin family protein n=2 Tax=Enterococcus gallinarum TaxID=1353 RepID=UPI003D1162AC